MNEDECGDSHVGLTNLLCEQHATGGESWLLTEGDDGGDKEGKGDDVQLELGPFASWPRGPNTSQTSRTRRVVWARGVASE